MEIEAAAPRPPPWWARAAAALRPTGRPQPFVRLATSEAASEAPTSDGDTASVVGPSPEDGASWVSRLLFAYATPLVRLGGQRPLETDDLWPVSPRDASAGAATSFRAALAASATPDAPQGRLARALAAEYGGAFAVAGVIKLVHDGIMFLSPVILRHLLRTHDDRGAAAGLALALATAGAAECLTVNAYFHILFRVQLHARAALVDTLYAKGLRTSAAARDARGAGAVANLMSNDAAKLWALPSYLHMLWSAPLQIGVVMAMLVSVLGRLPAAVALAVTVAVIPTSTAVARVLASLRRAVAAATDARVKLEAEVVGGIRAVKLHAWEEPYVDRVTRLRNVELRAIRRFAFTNIFNTLLFQAAPILISAAALATYALRGGALTADVAFPALALFQLLRFPVMMLPSQITAIVQGRVAVARIQEYLAEEEVAPPALTPAAVAPAPAVTVDGAAFAWRAGGPPALRVPSLALRAGSLTVVVGRIGAGKSALLAALLGEMPALRGRVGVAGRVSYAPQTPWLRNASLRDNILFDAPLRAAWYDAVVAACALTVDIADLPAGDATEIGERGVNLSGGQKARVALARACYADADVVLADDPLAAVDAHVGRTLWRDAICGLLRGRTRIVVTHHAHLAADADTVVVVRDGAVVEVGPPADLAARGVDIGALVVEEEEDAAADDAAPRARPPSGPPAPPTPGGTPPREEQDAAPAAEPAAPLPPPPPPPGQDDDDEASELVPLSLDGPSTRSDAQPKTAEITPTTSLTARASGSTRIVKAETRAVGRVARDVYATYLRAWGSLACVPLPLAILATATVERALGAGQTVYLAHWSDATAAGAPPPAGLAVAAYSSMGGASLALAVVRAAATVAGSTAAAARLHARLLATVVRLPMAFFDAQPSGRLLNRFSRDTEAIDTAIGDTVQSAITCFSQVVFAVVVALAATPGLAAFLVPLAWVYWRVQAAYIAASREVKRLDSVALSPVYGAFSETLAGVTTIRAFRAAGPATARQARLVDASSRTLWPLRVLDRWLSARLELLANGVVGGCALVYAVAPPASAGVAGLALTSALQLTGLLNWAVRKATELEVNMNAVERVTDCDGEPREAPAVIPSSRPPPGWPTAGAITVDRLVVRYRADLDPVLRGVTFAAAPAAKVGVVGRTGSGKSTLAAALFRIVEPDSGRVIIDGVDTASIGLADLRSSLGLVPQDAVLFSGDIRANLDPLAAHADAALWAALDAASLGDTVRALPAGLQSPVAEGGANLSAGERQLLAIARALLRSPRVLVLDESTSACDAATDAAIQAALRTHFKAATVLTIAHRLHTIADSDAVLVMDAGRVAEYGPPADLLTRPGGAFRGLVDEAARGGRGARDVGRAASAADLLARVGAQGG